MLRFLMLHEPCVLLGAGFCTFLQALLVLGTLVLSVAAYFDGNRHCAIDQFGRGCGRLRWAAVQLRRRSIARRAQEHPACVLVWRSAQHRRGEVQP